MSKSISARRKPAQSASAHRRIVVDVTDDFRLAAQVAVRVLGYKTLSHFLRDKMKDAIARATDKQLDVLKRK